MIKRSIEVAFNNRALEEVCSKRVLALWAFLISIRNWGNTIRHFPQVFISCWGFISLVRLCTLSPTTPSCLLLTNISANAFVSRSVCGSCEYWRIFLNSAFNILSGNLLLGIVISLCSEDKHCRVVQTFNSSWIGKRSRRVVRKEFQIRILGKQQSANSSQINTLNMSNACFFCSAPFLGFKVTNRFQKQTQIFCLPLSSISICRRKEVVFFVCFFFNILKKSALFRVASITSFLIDWSLNKRVLLLTPA